MRSLTTEKRHCAACNGLKCLIFGGPDGAYTLCNVCNRFYVEGKLRLYRTSREVSARAVPGAERVTVKRFKAAVHNRSQCNRMRPVVRRATKSEHQGYPLPADKDQKRFILTQAALVDGDDVETEDDDTDDDDEFEEDGEKQEESIMQEDGKTGEEYKVTNEDESKERYEIKKEQKAGRAKKLRRVGGDDLVPVKVEYLRRGMAESEKEKRRLVFRKGMEWTAVNKQLVDTSSCYNVDVDAEWFVTYATGDGEWTLLHGAKDLEAFFEYAKYLAKRKPEYGRRALVRVRLVECSEF